MLLRFISKNLYSFNEETEFNLFPSSRTTHHLHHKVSCGHAKALRMSAIYGANGAGKSNLIKALTLMDLIVTDGNVEFLSNQQTDLAFRFSNEKNNPISLAIEFYKNEKIYYYTISFVSGIITNEELYQSLENNDVRIFSREIIDGKQKITFAEGFSENASNATFLEVLQDRILRPEEVLLSFLASKYPNEFHDATSAHEWFIQNLMTVFPGGRPGISAHLFDSNPQMLDLLNTLLPQMRTGVSKMKIWKGVVDENSHTLSEEWRKLIPILKENPGKAYPMYHTFDDRVTASAVYEDGKVIMKTLEPIHKLEDGSEVAMPIYSESDGTLRLIDYIPFIYSIIHEDRIYIIDEIERSLHPILIKEIINKISSINEAKGQLIFTTHESCLLDQKILRSDEIWFAEKDGGQSTHLYPLSDFNIHSTANIENGYLNGRYGGIPFLSNLRDLNW